MDGRLVSDLVMNLWVIWNRKQPYHILQDINGTGFQNIEYAFIRAMLQNIVKIQIQNEKQSYLKIKQGFIASNAEHFHW